MCLGRAWLADVPSSTHDQDAGQAWVAVERCSTRGLTAEGVAAMRDALFRGVAHAAAGVPIAALVPALLAAAGCGLTDIGHVWHPSSAVEEAATAAGLPPDSPAFPRKLSWLEHAARAAAGCAQGFDAHYAPFDDAAVMEEWAVGVLECHDYEYQSWLETSAAKAPRFAAFQEATPMPELARALWQWARVHRCWPWEQPFWALRGNLLEGMRAGLAATLPPEQVQARIDEFEAEMQAIHAGNADEELMTSSADEAAEEEDEEWDDEE